MHVESMQAERRLHSIDRVASLVLLRAIDEHLRAHKTMQRELRVHLLTREQHVLLPMLEWRSGLRLGLPLANRTGRSWRDDGAGGDFHTRRRQLGSALREHISRAQDSRRRWRQ